MQFAVMKFALGENSLYLLLPTNMLLCIVHTLYNMLLHTLKLLEGAIKKFRDFEGT